MFHNQKYGKIKILCRKEGELLSADAIIQSYYNNKEQCRYREPHLHNEDLWCYIVDMTQEVYRSNEVYCIKLSVSTQQNAKWTGARVRKKIRM